MKTETPIGIKTEVVKHLMLNLGFSETEALAELDDMRLQVMQGEDPEELLYEIGLEPDYLFDLL
jgi:hypothetical protein